MALAAGSPAKVPCPDCGATEAKVALHPQQAVYYGCSACHQVWSAPKCEADTRKAS